LSGSSVKELREELERTNGELDAARAELWQARDRISAMEMSRFWKLRNLWWSVKRRLGLSVPAAPAPASDSAPAAEIVRLPGLTPVPFRFGPPAARPDRIDVVFVAGSDETASRAALDSLVRFCRPPVAFFVVGPGGASERADGLAGLCRDVDATLKPPGADALGRALRAGSSDFVFVVDATSRLLTDSLDRLLACVLSDPACVAAVPLSRGLLGAGPGTAGDEALAIAGDSARIYPALEAGGGAAFVARRAALAGREASTPAGLLRSLRSAGIVRVADDVWMETGDSRVGKEARGPAFDGVAGRLANLAEQNGRRTRGLGCWEGRRVLFVLPVLGRGGGANVVLAEARALATFGVEARVFNLGAHRAEFEESYPTPPVPVVFGHARDLVSIGRRYDAVVATANVSVEWVAPLASAPKPPVLGYYIQDYEPLFYPEGSRDRERAEASYGLSPDLRCFAKTEWNAAMVREKAGLPCAVIGPSFDTQTFRPRLDALPEGPVRIAAMIRPSTPRRQPRFTLEVLREAARTFGDAVEIVLFGVDASDPALASLPFDLPHRFLGVLHERALAALFAQVHVFADFSSYQAMGLTALEAMGAGAAVVVPRKGGAASFARDGENAVLVDTASARACVEALGRLVADPARRAGMAACARDDVVRHTPESAAYRMLEVLFGAA